MKCETDKKQPEMTAFSNKVYAYLSLLCDCMPLQTSTQARARARRDATNLWAAMMSEDKRGRVCVCACVKANMVESMRLRRQTRERKKTMSFVHCLHNCKAAWFLTTI